MIRSAILALLFLSSVARAQAVEENDKLSNDQPGRPLQMPAASAETKEAFEDFARFERKGAWERATKALYAIPDAQAARFVDGKDGFIIPVARKRREVLSGLSTEGMAAYRLFYDADAKKMLDQAEGAAEQATLEKLFSAYFLTSIGDNAADRLGDLYFEQGRFDRAADCWLAVLRERTDTELSPALLAVKSAIALSRAGRKAEIESLRGELAGRYADEVVTIGGRKAKVVEHLKEALGDAPASKPAVPGPTAGEGPSPALAGPVAAAWQLRFAASVTAGMTPAEVAQWERNTLSGAVPAVAVEGTTLYANYLGFVFAVDLAGGKMLWRSAPFHNLEVSAGGNQAMTIDSGRYAMLAADGYAWSLGRDLRDASYQATSRLACRRSQTGEIVWQSADLSDYAGIEPMGLPILARDTLYLAGKSTATTGQDNMPRQVVIAIRPRDGKILWKAEVGTFRESQQYYYRGMSDTSAQPRLAYRSGSLYLDTHAGVLARIDAETGALDWGYAYPTEPVQSQSRFIFFNAPQGQTATPMSEAPLLAGDALLIKGAKADRVCAVDPDRMKVLWDRPIARSARLIGFDDQSLYLGGPDLGALDRQTRALKWSTPLPGGSEGGRVIVRPDGLWQLTPRGIFEVDPATGHVRRIFRGDDVGASGGDLILTDRWLLAISNRAISAYPRGSELVAGGEGSNPKTRGSDD